MEYIMTMLREYILTPIIIAACGAALIMIKRYGDRLTRGSSANSELKSLESSVEIRRGVMDDLDRIVKAAVATNMSFVEDLKKSGRKLTQEESDKLNADARTLIFNSLPTEVKAEDGKIMQIIGGPEALDACISLLIEKHVYEYKPESRANIAEGLNIASSGEIASDEFDEEEDIEMDVLEEPEEPLSDEEPTESVAAAPMEFTIPKAYQRGVG